MIILTLLALISVFALNYFVLIITPLLIIEMTGRKVATLVNSRQAPGSYQIKFDGSNLASGMYLYRLIAGQTTQTRKLVLVK